MEEDNISLRKTKENSFHADSNIQTAEHELIQILSEALINRDLTKAESILRESYSIIDGFNLLSKTRKTILEKFKARECNPAILNNSIETLRYLLPTQIPNPQDIFIIISYFFEYLGDSQNADKCLKFAIYFFNDINKDLPKISGFFIHLIRGLKKDPLHRAKLIFKIINNFYHPDHKVSEIILGQYRKVLANRRFWASTNKSDSYWKEKNYSLFLFWTKKAISAIEEIRIEKESAGWLNECLMRLEEAGDHLRVIGSKTISDESYNLAIKGHKIFISLHPDELTNYHGVLKILERLEDKAGQKEYAERVIELGQGLEAKLSLKDRKVYKTYTSLADAHRIMGLLFLEEGSFTTGKECFEKAISLFIPFEHNKGGDSFVIERMAVCYQGIFKCEKEFGEKNEEELESLISRSIDCYRSLIQRNDRQGIFWYQGYLGLGDTYLAKGDLLEAERSYLKCKEHKPSDSVAYSKLMMLYVQMMRYTEAICIVREILKLSQIKRSETSMDHFFYMLALCYAEKGERKKAKRLFKYIISRRQPNNLVSHEKMIHLLIEDQEWGAAISLLEKKIPLSQNHNRFFDFCRLGDCYRALKDFTKALDAYNEAERLNPDSLPILERLATYFVKQNVNVSIHYINKILEIVGDNSGNLMWLGKLYEKKNDIEKAIDCYIKAKVLDPFRRGINEKIADLSNKAESLAVQICRYEDKLNKVLPEDKKNIHTVLVDLYLSRQEPGDVQLARISLDGSIYDPASLPYLLRKATILSLDREIHEEIKVRKEIALLINISPFQQIYNIGSLLKLLLFSSSVKLDHEEVILYLKMLEEYAGSANNFYSKYALEVLSNFHWEIGDLFQAKLYNDQLIEIDSEDLIALTRRGRFYLSQGYYREAKECFERVITIALDREGRKDSRALFFLGIIYKHEDKLLEAIQKFEEAYELDKHIGCLDKIAEIQTQRGLFSESISTYSKILSINSKDIIALYGQARAYIFLDSEEGYKEGINNFIQILNINPKDKSALRYLVQLSKHPEARHYLITALKGENVDIQINLIELLTEECVFSEELIVIIKDCFKNSNLRVQRSIAQYYMKFTIQQYYFGEGRWYIEDILYKLFSLFQSHSLNFPDILVEYLGSVKNAYLKFMALRAQPKLKEMQNIIESLSSKEEISKARQTVNSLLNAAKGQELTNSFSGQDVVKMDLAKYLRECVQSLQKEYDYIDFCSTYHSEPVLISSFVNKEVIYFIEYIIDNYISGIASTNPTSRIFLELNSNSLKIIYIPGSFDVDSELLRPQEMSNLKTFLDSFHSKREFTIKYSLKETLIIFLQFSITSVNNVIYPRFLDYIIETYREFDVWHREDKYWRKARELFFRDFSERSSLVFEDFINYLFIQLDTLFLICRNEFPVPLSFPYHKIKNILSDMEMNHDKFTERDLIRRRNEIGVLIKQVNNYFGSFRFPEATWFSLKDLIASILCEHKKQYSSQGISFEFIIDPEEEFQFLGDEKFFSDVLEQLIKNAIEAIQEKREKLKFIEQEKVFCSLLTKEIDGGYYYNLIVKDTGIGYDPLKVTELFNLNKSNKVYGSGLGLKMIVHALKLHSAQIKPSSFGVGKGMSFDLLLPLDQSIEKMFKRRRG